MTQNTTCICAWGSIKAIIPRDEAALGIKEGTVKDVAIITRVNKMVCFKVTNIAQRDGETVAFLSRRKAQEECEKYIFDTLQTGDIIDARVTHLDSSVRFAVIGCGIISMISIDNISVSRIEHPKNRFTAGMDIKAVVKSIDYAAGRINLSHKELLGTWEQNAQMFRAGETVSGIVRSIESYGIFIELTPNLCRARRADSRRHCRQPRKRLHKKYYTRKNESKTCGCRSYRRAKLTGTP